MTLTVEQIPLADLRPHPRNPRRNRTDLIADSLRANGQYAPLIAAADGTVLVGNHRYAAMMEMGWDTAHVIVVPYGPDDPRALRIMLADNRTADTGGQDPSSLAVLLAALARDDTLYGTGYDTDDLIALAAKIDKDLATPLDLGHQHADPEPITLRYPAAEHARITAALHLAAEHLGTTGHPATIAALLAPYLEDPA